MANPYATQTFPGNPFEHITPTGQSGPDAVARAIQLLAFEVRTANIQRQAAVVASGPDFTGASADTYALWEGMTIDIGTRLGVPDL